MGMASTSKIRKPPGEGELAEKRAARRVSSGPRPVWKQEIRAKHTGRLATTTTTTRYACTYASAMDPLCTDDNHHCAKRCMRSRTHSLVWGTRCGALPDVLYVGCTFARLPSSVLCAGTFGGRCLGVGRRAVSAVSTVTVTFWATSCK